MVNAKAMAGGHGQHRKQQLAALRGLRVQAREGAAVPGRSGAGLTQAARQPAVPAAARRRALLRRQQRLAPARGPALAAAPGRARQRARERGRGQRRRGRGLVQSGPPKLAPGPAPAAARRGGWRAQGRARGTPRVGVGRGWLVGRPWRGERGRRPRGRGWGSPHRDPPEGAAGRHTLQGIGQRGGLWGLSGRDDGRDRAGGAGAGVPARNAARRAAPCLPFQPSSAGASASEGHGQPHPPTHSIIPRPRHSSP